MPRFLDLFAGAGGLSEGFIQAGYTPVSHVEMDEAACFTLKTRAAYYWLKQNGKCELYNRYLKQQITRAQLYENIPKSVLDSVLNYEISSDTIPEILEKIDSALGEEKLDIIVGGPPCQAYSLAGRARSENGMVGDRRNYLYKLYAQFLQHYKPEYFVFENVVGLFSAKEIDGTKHFDNMCTLFQQCGYSTEYRVLNATDYGVLQNRRRIILIGKLGENVTGFYPDVPKETTGDVTVNELFKDLPEIQAGGGTYIPTATNHYDGKYLYEVGIKESDCEEVSYHCARPNTDQDLEIYKIAVEMWNHEKTRLSYTDLPEHLRTHKNLTSFLDRFKVVAGDLSHSQTVVAHIARDGHYYIHPDINQNRSLTPREVARLQTFPDNYYFECKKEGPGRTAAYKQIGNAVPVRLAYMVAKALKPQIDDPNICKITKKTDLYVGNQISIFDDERE